MTRRVTSFSILIMVAALVVVGLGLSTFLEIQPEPTASLQTMEVSFSWQHASARTVEQEVTCRLEALFSGVRGIKDIASVSSEGSGRITLYFKDGVALDVVRYEVASLVRQAYPKLPSAVTYPTISLSTTGKKRIALVNYNVVGHASTYQLKQYAERNIVPHLSIVEGVSEVEILGAGSREYQITLDNLVLQNIGIRPGDVLGAIQMYFATTTLGMGEYCVTQDACDQSIQLVLMNDRRQTLEWSQIPIVRRGGRILYLGAIAGIKIQEQDPERYYRINGLNAVVLGVYAEEGRNAIQVRRAVAGVMRELRKALPPHYDISDTDDTIETFSHDLRRIMMRALCSVLMFLLVVLAVTRDWRYLLVSMLGIGANLSIAGIFYYLLGVEIHPYSLATISISVGITAGHGLTAMRRFSRLGDPQHFFVLLAVVLAIGGAVAVIFFMEPVWRLPLIDFAWVILINAVVSMGVSCVFIPALLDKLSVGPPRKRFRKSRYSVWRRKVYARYIGFGRQWRWAWVVALILAFGIPVHWLPNQLEQRDVRFYEQYNKTLGSERFVEDIKPWLETILGGTLRLFSENIIETAHEAVARRTALIVRGKLSDGGTARQLNTIVERIENFISGHPGIALFQTAVAGGDNAYILVFFTPDAEQQLFHHQFKEMVVAKVKNLGGVDWSVEGIGMGFSNAVDIRYGRGGIVLEGYNYEHLYAYADLLRKSLLKNDRVKRAHIQSEDHGVQHEYALGFDPEVFALYDFRLGDFYSHFTQQLQRGQVYEVLDGDEHVPVVFTTRNAAAYDRWWVTHDPVGAGTLTTVGDFKKRMVGQTIGRFNQQYRLVVSIEFEGEGKLAERLIERSVDDLEASLPIGYTVGTAEDDNQDKTTTKYLLIVVALLIIYIVGGILLESLAQPLAVMLLVPAAYIGAFLTFYLFEIPFNQGGYMSLLLLCGLAVSPGLYILNEANVHRKRYPRVTGVKLYLRAFYARIVPVGLAQVAMVLCFVPFFWNGRKDLFWYSFSTGTTGGLIVSGIAFMLLFPVLNGIKNKKRT